MSEGGDGGDEAAGVTPMSGLKRGLLYVVGLACAAAIGGWALPMLLIDTVLPHMGLASLVYFMAGVVLGAVIGGSRGAYLALKKPQRLVAYTVKLVATLAVLALLVWIRFAVLGHSI